MAHGLGFENKETICTEEARTAEELIGILRKFVDRTTKDADIVYVENGEDNRVTLRLVENTLTDGSKTYDIRISY